METKIIKPSSEDELIKAAELIRGGGLVAIPTETVYGLGANALDGAAVDRIFTAKGRPRDNPLIIHVTCADEIEKYCFDVPDAAYVLAARFWPGPLTMIFKCRPCVPPETTAGLATVAVRCPASRLTRELIRLSGVPIAAPSANTSGRPSPTRAEDVFEDMQGKIPLIIDGGECSVGVESTIIDLTETPPRLLRPGGLALEELEAVVGPISVDRAVTQPLKDGEKPKAPGMKYRHYAPKAPLTVVCGDAGRSAEYIKTHASPGDGVICFTEFVDSFPDMIVRDFGASCCAGEQARRVFTALRSFDSTGAPRIFAQCPSETGVGRAVVNRLKKAAGFNIVELS